MTLESVLITGTTSGVGRALLEHYTGNGKRVVAVNRRRVPQLEEQHPAVRFECVDVRATQRVARLVQELAASAELPEVLILNAGINRVDNDEAFDGASYRAVLDTNLHGVLNFVEPLTQLARGSVLRHVIAVSSMVTYAGNPYGLGYTTSKRALSTCFEAWSKMYAGSDLVFQQVILGPVDTAMFNMADQFPPWVAQVRQAFSGSTEGAVRAISRFALTGKQKLYYPRRAVPLFLALGLGQALIPGFFQGRKTLAGKARRKAPSDLDARSGKAKDGRND